MACLIDLSSELQVRVEALHKELSDSGLGEFALDEELPVEVAEFLIHQFTTDPEKRGWFPRLRGFLGRLRGKRRDIREAEESLSHEVAPASPIDQMAVLPPALAPEEEIPLDMPLEEGTEETGQELTDLLESMDEYLPAEGESGDEEALPVPPETMRVSEVSVESTEVSGPLAFPPLEEEVSEEPKPGLPQDLLMASLEQIEQIQGDLGSGPVEIFEELLPDLNQEPEIVEPLLALEEEEEVEEEDLSEFSLTAPPEELSSIRLQALVDNLAEGLPDLNTVPTVKKIPLLVRLRRFIPSIHLNLKQKMALVGACMVASGLIAASLFTRGVNYGPGGDKRFFEEGLTLVHSNRYESALEAFSKVVDRYPKSPFVLESYRHKAVINRTIGNMNGAVNEMNQGLRTQSKMLGEDTGEWSEVDRDYRLKGLYFLGDVHAGEKKWAAAAEKFSSILDATPPESLRQRTLYRLADALYHDEEGEDSGSATLRALALSNEIALEASPESQWTDITRYRLSLLWEELAGLELGIREENLEKSLESMRQIESKGLAVGRTGIDPLDVKLHIGRLLRELGKADESIALYRVILSATSEPMEDITPPFAVIAGLARSLLARAETGKGASPEADLYEVLELVRNKENSPLNEQDLTEALYLRGHAYYQLGVLIPGKAEGSESTYFEKMDNAYQGALSRNEHFGIRGEDSLLAMMRRTNYLFQVNQDYRDAARSYRHILDQFPDSVYSYRVRHRLGSALFQLGEYAEAEQLFREVVDQFGQTRFVDDKAFRDSYFRLGHCQFLLKDYLRAADTIKTLLHLLDYEETPEGLASWRLLAEAYYAQGLYDQAIEEYRNYLTRFPNQDTEGKIRLSLGRTLISRFDYDEGRREMQRVIDADPQSQSSRLARYFVCESFLTEYNLAPQENRTVLLTQALDQADQLRKAYPSEDTPLYLLGKIHFLMGDYERATRDLEYFCNSAQGQRPLALAQLFLGESYFNLKNFKRAANKLSLVNLAELPRDQAARALYLLAESQRFEKQFQQAADTYARLAKDYPASPYSELVDGRIQEVQWRQKTGI